MGAVGVGGQHRAGGGAQQPQRQCACGVAVLTGDRPGVDLQHAALGKLVGDHRFARGRAPRTLRMRDDDREASFAQLVGGSGVALVEPVERGLQKQPPPFLRTLGDHLELGLPQTPDHVERELTARQHLYRDPGRPQARVEFAHPIGDLAGIGDVQGMDMRCGDDRSRAVGDRQLRELEALLQRRRTVVDARQQVEVDL